MYIKDSEDLIRNEGDRNITNGGMWKQSGLAAKTAGFLSFKSTDVLSSKLPQHPAYTLVINLLYNYWFSMFIFDSRTRTSNSP